MWVDNVSAAWLSRPGGPRYGQAPPTAGRLPGSPSGDLAPGGGQPPRQSLPGGAEMAGISRGSSPNTRAAFRSVHQASWDSSPASALAHLSASGQASGVSLRAEGRRAARAAAACPARPPPQRSHLCDCHLGRAALVSAKRAAHWPAATWRSASGHGHTMATGDTASDPFSRSAQHGRSRPRGCAAGGCDDRHHVDLPPRAGGTLRSSPSSQRSAVQKQAEISKCRRR